MTYQDTVNWMFSQLPMYQRQGKSAYKTDLSNTIKLANHLGNPENSFNTVHVAGTNGKGSTSHMLASVLQQSGYKVGLYTSPHLKDFRERIKINGKEISKQFVIGFIRKNKTFFEVNALSFFEMTVGMAFDYFAKKKVDIAIVEVGLGGRLDSTNILIPKVSVITNIGMDHTQFLGDTIEKIAIEKAGVIKEHIPVVIGETQEVTAPLFKKIAREKKAKIYFADSEVSQMYSSDLKGSYQRHNIKTVIKTIDVLQQQGYVVTSSHVKKGLINVNNNTGLKGRWQTLQEHPKIICDVAHNKEGLSYTLSQLQNETYNKLHIVLGFVSDKHLQSIIGLFPKEAIYYFCKPSISRGMDAQLVLNTFKNEDYNGDAYDSVAEAFTNAKKMASKDDLIYVGGSTFVVADII